MAELKRLGSAPAFVDYYNHEEFEQALLVDAEDMGYEAGREEGKIDIINKMLEKGKTLEEICDLLDFSVEEIQSILDHTNK